MSLKQMHTASIVVYATLLVNNIVPMKLGFHALLKSMLDGVSIAGYATGYSTLLMNGPNETGLACTG